jgi:hypothetical protein
VSKRPESKVQPVGDRLLTERIKSAILDQLIEDLRRGVTGEVASSYYSKSDSGLYGKYSKADVPSLALLDTIKANLEVMIAEALSRVPPNFGVEETRQAPEPKK